jgi:probable F420-dependent oxidoreductase
MKVGLVVIMADLPPSGTTPRYRAVREVALEAEAAGFDSIWLADHLLYRVPNQPTGGIWECWTMLSALAEATTRVELGTWVACTQFRNPALLAKMAVTLDEVSNGRFTLGVGAGWNRPEFDAFGFPFDHRVDRFEEALQIIAPLLRTGHVDFHGTYYQVHDCEIRPRGPREAGPPLMVAAFGPRMLRLAARYADIWNYGMVGKPDMLAAPRAALEEACKDVGRDLSTLAITASIALALPELGEVTHEVEGALTGSAQEIAAALGGYAALGVRHVMFEVLTYTPAALARLTEALHIYRGQVG